MKQSVRQLRGYSLDPGFSTRLDTAGINEITYQIRWEDVREGPVGDYFEVIDIDPASNCFYDPVDLNGENVLAQNGLDPSEGNPKFHQQFVYTIAMKTLEHFEQSLGRKVIWSPKHNIKTVSKTDDSAGYVDKIRLYPHALRDANAYYDPEKKAILFGYFEAAAQVQGTNFPGGVIFTCLSPDIIAHEVTHAILDSIHPRFIENTNPDVPAFHEGFADIVALLQRFTIPQLVEHQIAQTRGRLEEFSFLGELATQFGSALQGSRGALRGAIGAADDKGVWRKHTPNPDDYKTVFEPHARGAILVATVYDAFIRLYNSTTADLLRIATNGTGILQPGAIHPDLVRRLAATACELAERLLHICICALDYCPPHDITFGDYLRALITADIDSSPKDTSGYRLALIEAFRSWGIFPDCVNTLSVESLKWMKRGNLTAREQKALNYLARFLKSNVRDIADISTLETNNRKEIYKRSRQVQRDLHRQLIEERQDSFLPKHWSAFLKKLGLTDQTKDFQYGDEIITTEKIPLLEVHKVRPVYRVGREGKLVEQVLVTITQTFRIENGDLKGAKFRGGCTLILNMSKDYDVEYIIHKSITSDHRFKEQMDYQNGKTASFIAFNDSMYSEGSIDTINFEHLHLH